MKQCTPCSTQGPRSKSNAIIVMAIHFGRRKPTLPNRLRHALETHQTKADASACLFKHSLKAHTRRLCGSCCWSRSDGSGGCFILVHTVLWQGGPGAAAHSFMSEPDTGTAATTKAVKLHHPANALISPVLAAE